MGDKHQEVVQGGMRQEVLLPAVGDKHQEALDMEEGHPMKNDPQQ